MARDCHERVDLFGAIEHAFSTTTTTTTMPAFELQDELNALQDIETYEISNDRDFSTEDPEALLEGGKKSVSPRVLTNVLIAAVEAVADSSDNIAEPEVFDAYRSLLKHSNMVPGPIMSKLLDSISSGLQAELEATQRDIDTGDQQTYMSHKRPLEMYAFLLNWFVTAVEKVKVPEEGDGAPAPKSRKGKGGKATTSKASGRAGAKKADTTWTWREQIIPTLVLISKLLHRLQTQRIWTTTAERNTFVKCVILFWQSRILLTPDTVA